MNKPFVVDISIIPSLTVMVIVDLTDAIMAAAFVWTPDQSERG